MHQVKDATREATIERVIEQSLTSAQPFFILSALPEGQMASNHEPLQSTWDRLRGQGRQRKKVVRDLAVTRFSLPWSERPALSFYHRCIERWSMRELSSCLSLAEGEGVYTCESALIEDALKRLADPDINRPPGAMPGAWRASILHLLQAYLTDSCSQAELRKLALARNLTTEDRYMLLQCIWQCLQGLREGLAVEEHTRLWLGVDEVETFLDYPAKEQRDLTRGITHLVTSTGSFLTVWLNISDSSPEVIARVKTAFGSKLWEFLDEDLTGQEQVQGDPLS